MTKLETLNLDFLASGNQFYKDASFDKVVYFLGCINSIAKTSFKTALNEQYSKSKDVYGIEPEIRVNSLGISSVSGTIYTIVPPMLGLLAPNINSMTWEYLKNSFELIKAMTSCFFADREKLPLINIGDNTEGSSVIAATDGSRVIVNNNNIVINAKQLVTPIGQLADMVRTETIGTIHILPKEIDDSPIKIEKEIVDTMMLESYI